MDDLLSEKEQIEQIRGWWSEFGGYVIFGIAAGAVLLYGWNYYQNSKLNAQLEASALYETLTGHVVDGDLEDAEVVAGEIATTYAETTYSAQSKLALARLYMDKNRDQDAADILGELLASDSDDAIKHVARSRLARILLYQDKAEEVIDLLAGEETPAFAAAYAELLGDAYHALDRTDEAQAAYQRVLMDPLSQGTVDQRLVQWKVLDLPEVADQETVDQEIADQEMVDGESSGDEEAAEPASEQTVEETGATEEIVE